MATVGWILLGVVLTLGAGVFFFFVSTLMALNRRLRRFTVKVRYAQRPELNEASLAVALPGATLTRDEASPNVWFAEHPEDGVYWIDLREREREPEGGVPATTFDLVLELEGRGTPTVADDAAALEKLCKLAAVFARLEGVAVSVGRFPTAFSRLIPTGPHDERVALVTPALLEELSAGRSGALGVPVTMPTSVREFFEPAREVEGIPGTFRLDGPRARGIACARHYFPGDVRFDWPRIADLVSSRGWRASVSEPRPGLMLVEFPELVLEFSGERRPARVMFEARGTEGAAPASDPRLGIQFEALSAKLPRRVWRFVLYDNNSGFPAGLRLRLLSEVSRAMAEQHQPLMMGWDDAGHFIDPTAFHGANDDALATSVVALKIAQVNGAPPDKSFFVTTTGLSDLALPEVEFIASTDRVERFAPLVADTARLLVQRGPVFNDGETLGHDTSFAGRLRVLYAQSLEAPERFVMALQ
ncbi:MAG: DUF4261 domain-containing protein [Myxococcales bacterium]|nr:DUF4261 domain-containing protein [Myxococcales bacterium]